MSSTCSSQDFEDNKDTDLPIDTGIVTGRQRVKAESRPKEKFLCPLLGAECPFMPIGGFDNCAKVKEDSVRHINGYQCDICGKRFGKRYGLNRHNNENKKQCTVGTIPKVSRGIAGLLLALEKVKGYEGIKEIMIQCKPHCDWDQISKDQKQAEDEQPSTRRTKKIGMRLQRKATQGRNALEPPGPFDPVASRSSRESHRNDGMTSGGGSALEQQGGAQALGRDIRAHVYNKDLDVGYEDYSDTGSQDYPQVTESPSDRGGLAVTDYIYISPIIQSVVGTQADYPSQAVGPSFISNPPISPEGSMATYRTAATTNHPQNPSFAQGPNAAYGHGASQCGMNNHFPYSAVGSTTAHSQSPNLIPGPYYQQPIPVPETPVDQYGDCGLPVAASWAIDSLLLENTQPSGSDFDNSNESPQDTGDPTIMASHNLGMWLQRDPGP